MLRCRKYTKIILVLIKAQVINIFNDQKGLFLVKRKSKSVFYGIGILIISLHILRIPKLAIPPAPNIPGLKCCSQHYGIFQTGEPYHQTQYRVLQMYQ